MESDALVNALSVEKLVSNIQHERGFTALKVPDESRVGACMENERDL